MESAKKQSSQERVKDGNTCIGMGVGIGAVSVGAAVVTGAVCPFCYLAVPALVGMGFYERREAKKLRQTEPQESQKESTAKVKA